MRRQIIAIMLLTIALSPMAASAQSKKKTSSAPSQTQAIGQTIRVTVSVSAANSFKSTLTTCIRSNLRKIKEISIVDDFSIQNDHYISIVAIENESKSNIKLGYSATIFVGDYISKYFINRAIGEETIEENSKAAHNYYRLFVIPNQHYLLTDSDLSSLCTRIVSQIDDQVFEENRQSYRKIQESIKPTQ